MSEIQVRVVKLEPQRVASALGFGPNPEDLSWKKLFDWARAKGLLNNWQMHRYFGFNNPNPSPGSPNYGYEEWMTVGPEVEAEGEIQVKEFSGGLYAVLRCDEIPNPRIWGQLVQWRERSPYKAAHHQWLEECFNPLDPPDKLHFDLYLPIAK